MRAIRLKFPKDLREISLVFIITCKTSFYAGLDDIAISPDLYELPKEGQEYIDAHFYMQEVFKQNPLLGKLDEKDEDLLSSITNASIIQDIDIKDNNNDNNNEILALNAMEIEKKTEDIKIKNLDVIQNDNNSEIYDVLKNLPKKLELFDQQQLEKEEKLKNKMEEETGIEDLESAVKSLSNLNQEDLENYLKNFDEETKIILHDLISQTKTDANKEIINKMPQNFDNINNNPLNFNNKNNNMNRKFYPQGNINLNQNKPYFMGNNQFVNQNIHQTNYQNMNKWNNNKNFNMPPNFNPNFNKNLPGGGFMKNNQNPPITFLANQQQSMNLYKI